jgi:tRNA-2-methylthio-N6-dimethylallyladenosine synthase
MPRYHVKTFGCQMNVHDSERIEETLRASGYSPAEASEDSDLVVVNTCSVRDKAEQKIRSMAGALRALKRKRPGLVVAVAGCVAQQEGEKLLDRMGVVDIVLGPDNIPELPRLIDAVLGGSPPIVRTVHDVDEPVFLRALPDAGRGAASAFVTIMKGCDERCSFCIVPYTRGPERYRSSREVIDEVARLVAAGTREVTLLGQTVNSYRDPDGSLPKARDANPGDPDESEFAALLRAIAEAVPGLGRLRYTSPHPRHVTPSLIAAHGDLEVLAKHVHLPVQSGSDRILKRMIRRYTRAEYAERARSLRRARTDLTLSTDIIVGFPGETEGDFAATIDLVQEIGFTGLFGFKYSRRPHTPAQKLADDVPEDVKNTRLSALFALSEKLLAAHLGALVGRTERVLIEGESKAGSGRVTGRTERNEIVHVASAEPSSLIGQIVEVRLVRSYKHSLEGELVEGRAAPLRPQRRTLPILSAGSPES